MDNLKETSKVFKAGNSYGIRLTTNDKKLLNINTGEDMIKTISPDHMSITFTKKKEVSPDTLKIIDSLYNENVDLMEFLKDK
ncbi:hypothetical protein O0Z71_00745 [Ligilactobacillus saerimneri]|uniref:hypothetical protein n=1 Tax=Ligilactobacillus saerimneri TaxID=228229 RepID=UPI0022A7F5DD|nr:hypothetical protein [Ligilactobacillus saerimneri]MCZ0890985.1 hypothetical protein [Ligilactobacillus saerimneri]